MPDRDRLTHYASHQHGYFTSHQARGAGYTDVAQHYHVKMGNWLRMDPSLYRLTGYPDSLEGDFVRWSLWAIGRARQRRIVVSHQSALYYYGLCPEPPRQTHLCISTPVRRQVLPPECVLHHVTVDKDAYWRKSGFLITSPKRTLQDMKPDLLYAGTWSAAVLRAWQGEFISRPDAEELLGPAQFVRLTAMAEAWAGERLAEGAGLQPGRQGERSMNGMTAYPGMRRNEIAGGRMPNRTFTLVEMLVVISVIGILASLLMPALLNAQNLAIKTKCVSNLRQMGYAMTAYGNDFAGYFPNTGLTYSLWANGNYEYVHYLQNCNRYLMVTKEYLGDGNLVICPADTARKFSPWNWANLSKADMRATYGISYCYMGVYGRTPGKPRRLSEPLITGLAADGIVWAAGRGWLWNHNGQYEYDYGEESVLFSDGRVQTTITEPNTNPVQYGNKTSLDK